MTEQLSHHRREGIIEMNFSRLIFDLYRSGDIWFDEENELNMSAKATVQVQDCIKPTSLFNLDLDDTLAGKAIRKDFEAKQYRRNNEARIEDAVDCDSLKSALLSDFQVHYGVSR